MRPEPRSKPYNKERDMLSFLSMYMLISCRLAQKLNNLLSWSTISKPEILKELSTRAFFGTRWL